MIRFNVVGVGFLDMERGGVSLKTESQWFRFADIGLGRTTEFTVPANLHNRRLLDWPEDPAGYGEAMRVTYDARMHYDGGAMEGLLEVRGWEKGSFRCVFYFGASKKLEAMLDRPLKDCATTLGGVTWSTSSALTDAANASADVALVKYDNYWGIGNTSIQIQPSVKVKAFCEDVLTQLGATHSIGVSGDLYMVSPTLNGGAEDTVGFTQTSVSSTSISQTEGYFAVQSLNLEWATKLFFGSYVGGGSVASYGFKVVKKCSVTFDNTTPTGIFIVKWSDKLSQYDVLGGVDSDGTGDPHTSRGLGLYSEPLAGLTVQFEKGDVFFFTDHKFFTDTPVRYGYQDLAHPVTVGATVTGTGAMVDGDKWYVKNNMPEMTLFEFLKSVALATGKELTVSCSFGVPHVKIGDVAYNSQSDIIALERVTEVEGVSRVVDCWGEGTRYARLRFDSEDYVEEKVETFYEVGNVQNEGEEEATAKFSEGGVSSAENGSVLIRDRKEASSSESSAKAWTLGWAGSHATGHSLLVRVTAPDFIGYADIASASTCLKVRCHMAAEDFIALKMENTFAWRGAAYVWTDASWSGGIASLTLQKVAGVIGAGGVYDAEVEYLQSAGETQWINTGLKPKADDYIEIKFAIRNTTTSTKMAFGSRKDSATDRCYVYSYNGNIRITNWGNTNNNYVLLPKDAAMHTLVIDAAAGTATIDGGSPVNIGTSAATNYNYWLFTCNQNGSAAYSSNTRIASFKIRGRIDLIPVRKEGVGYMYDRISGALFGNDGTGSFTIGPDA